MFLYSIVAFDLLTYCAVYLCAMNSKINYANKLQIKFAI